MGERSRWRSGGDLHAAALRVVPVGCTIGAAVLAAYSVLYYVVGGGVGIDARAYWLGARTEHPYGLAPGERDAYLYSPLFAQLVRPLATLPWPLFCTVVLVACTLAYAWLLHPLPRRWRTAALLACVPGIVIGNVYALLAVATVVSLRRPAAPAGLALTKVTPFGPVFVWFLARRDWRRAAVAIGTVAALSALSFALDPTAWQEWVAFLTHHRNDRGWLFPARVVAALAVAAWAARSGRAWLLAVACWLAMPFGGLDVQSLVPLTAVVRMWSTTPAPARPRSAQSSSRPCSMA